MTHSLAKRTLRHVSIAAATATASAILTIATPASAACPEPDPGPRSYKSPSVASVCSTSDIDLLRAELTKPGATAPAVKAKLDAQSTACSSCVFTPEASSSWGPIVVAAGERGFYNFGACLELVTGSTVCAAAHTKWSWCSTVRCETASCADVAAKNQCREDVLADKSSCGQYDVQGSCPNIATDAQLCPDIVAVIGFVCGGVPVPKRDAGLSIPPAASDSGTEIGLPGEDEDENVVDGGATTTTPAKKRGVAPASSPSDGCAQGDAAGGGSLASALVVGFVSVTALSRRRRRAAP